MSRILIFSGSTLSAEQIKALIPAAEVRPPIAAGDLLQADLAPGDLVAIIDGFYFQSSPVRHKEILALLDAGVQVWGAASMGALRAAELAPFGMRGFGHIFQAYLDGTIEGDDEVAVLHAEEEMGYRNLTEALVNIRYTCNQAVSDGCLSSEEQALLVDIAHSLPFYERSYPHLLALAVEHGLSKAHATAFQNFVQQQSPDLKRNDALAMLQEIRTFSSTKITQTAFTLHETTFLRNWRVFGRSTDIGEKRSVSDAELLNASMLFATDYPRVRAHVLLQALAEIAQRALAVQTSHGSLQAVIHDQSLCEQANESATDDMRTELVARYIARQCSINSDETQALPEILCTYLRPGEQTLPRTQQLAYIGIRLWQEPRSLSWQKILLEHLKKSPAYMTLLKTVVQARAFNETLREQIQDLEIQRLHSGQICSWFLQRWGIIADEVNIALLERGFQSTTDLVEIARPFYLLDRYAGVAPFTLDSDEANAQRE